MDINPQWERFTTPRYFQAGAAIFNEGEVGDVVYIVKRGEVAVSKKLPDDAPFVLGYRGPGEMIGEMALLSEAPRSASMSAVKPTELLAINKADFWNLLRSDDDFRQVVMETLVNRVLVADESRIVAAIWEEDLAERFNHLHTEHERMAEIMQLRQETNRFIIHDLRNPLHLAMTALGMIEDEPDYNPNSETARFVVMAQGGLRRMLNLVDSLLEVGRLESSEVSLDLAPVEVREIIKRSVDGSQPMAITGSVTLTAEPGNGTPLPRVPADATRIERVLLNLIDNALRFTPRDGKVTVSAWREGDSVWVAVDDTGPGIPAEQRDRVFDRFVQTETGRKSTGFGLGLAFCRSAISAHGGVIRAEKGPGGVGTRMIFSLPLEPSQAKAHTAQ